MHEDLISLQGSNTQDGLITPLSLTHAIELNKVSYHYPNASQPALKDIGINIPAHSKVGFVGATGSGKTTAVDVTLGLLEPQKGRKRRWSAHQRRQPPSVATRYRLCIQHIYLADDSVTANIAFGVNAEDIDQQAVERAAKIANLHEFVSNDLLQGYETTVGEREVRLSGGQRQRVELPARSTMTRKF